MSLAALGMGLSFASSLLRARSDARDEAQVINSYYQQAAGYRQAAQQTRIKGSLQEDAMRRQNRAQIAKTSALMGESGMGESPTAYSSLATTASDLEQDVLNQRYQTESAAEDYLYRARLEEQSASLAKKKRRNNFLSSFLAGAGSVLTSGGFGYYGK